MRIPDAQREQVRQASGEFTQRLKRLRKQLKFTQAEAAAQFSVAAITWRKWESGARYPLGDMDRIRRVAKSLGVEV